VRNLQTRSVRSLAGGGICPQTSATVTHVGSSVWVSPMLVSSDPMTAATGTTRLLDAALADDPVALGWLAETHRPLLLTRGRLLFEQDPAEWGAASLEVLVASARFMQGDTGPWLRRQVSQQICHRMRRLVRRELARRGCERAVDPSRLPSLEPPGDPEPHPQLTVALERALGRLDDATSAGLRAVAMQLPLATVAADHDLTHAALRQRVARARRQLRPQLADFARSA
jgi:DNA-directed RNA polymerase specialized sigma24 family protein